MFKKTGIDLDDPKQARKFLEKHCRYCTLNSWNGMYSYAHNVKLHRLNLPSDVFDFAFDNLLDPDCDTSEYDFDQRWLIEKFDQEHHSDTYFNGRSSGWLVTVPRDIAGKAMLKGYPHPDDVDDDDICDLAHTIDDFDALCDDLRQLIIDTAERYDVVETEKTITITRTVKELVAKN